LTLSSLPEKKQKPPYLTSFLLITGLVELGFFKASYNPWNARVLARQDYEKYVQIWY
jgi:hypothetical protein